jgi:DHA3 family macrolide efflux protein-like MFS transporter
LPRCWLALLLPIITLTGILITDVVTFFLAIFALMLVHIPQPEKTVEGQAESGSAFCKEALYGFKYIFARRGLLGLAHLFHRCLEFHHRACRVSLFSPFILERTNQSSEILGIVTSANAIGAVVGGLLISLWGGFKKRMNSIFIGEALTGLFLLVVFGLGKQFA